ncbi:CYFA0S09e01552g1_1 [Cyberlindnera fabianii]|uniref:Phosphatidylserine decarboxylase proenzyme 1, mitochondrial n=1 Tax=Cyberlindnera fabianii TaxID=36022 RepID=A0A061AYM4_CYBFA|nr:CYFA0S09e01552g1_1 [Cyberlindnera fabianii]
MLSHVKHVVGATNAATAHATETLARKATAAPLKKGSRFITSYPFPKIPRSKRNALYYNTFYYGDKLKKGIKHRLPPIRGFSNTYERLNGSSTTEIKTKHNNQLIKYFIILSIGVIFYGVSSRYYYQARGKSLDDDDDEDENGEKRVKPTHSWSFFCYSTLPLNAISRLWGRVNSMDLPEWMREPGYKFYAYCFGANLDEMKVKDLKSYKNLSEFFYRELEDGARPVDNESDLVCPSDGLVLHYGVIDDGKIEQVKGLTYTLDAFLGDATNHKLAAPSHNVAFDHENPDDVQKRHEEFAQINGISYTLDDIIGGEGKNVTHLKKIIYKEEGDRSHTKAGTEKVVQVANDLAASKVMGSAHEKELFFAVIYLAPGDYHRYHSPTNWVVTLRRHFIGELYSVAPYFQKTLQNLFVLNERVSLLGYWKHGFFSMTPVGATNVGSIKVNFDKDLATNTKYESPHYKETGGQPVKVKKNTCYEATYEGASKILGGYPVTKGQEVGGFMLGSTVVLVFEAPKDFKFDIKQGQKVKMGQPLGSVASE